MTFEMVRHIGGQKPVTPASKPDEKKFTGRDVLLEAYNRMDAEFSKLGFPPTHPARVRLRNIVEKGLIDDKSAVGELGRIITAAALKGKTKI